MRFSPRFGASLLTSFLALAALLVPAGAAGQKQEHLPDPIVQVVPRDAIPAIHNPRFLPAGKASLAPGEKVLGIVIGNEAHAYPLIDLDRHEVVDDTVGGQPIAATW